MQPRWIPQLDYPGTIYAATQNGWMEENTFFDWFKRLFIPHVEIVSEKGNLMKTAFLFYDGHSSHISIRTIQEALEQLQLINGKKLLVEHGRTKMGHGPSRPAKAAFSTLLSRAWQSIKPKNITNGFVTTGLYPLDRVKIPEDLFNAMDLKKIW